MEKQIPKHLKGEPLEFYKSVVADFEIEPHHQKLLTMACDCLQRVIDARADIAKSGATFKDRYGQLKQSPSCKIEVDNKILFARLIREMQLDVDEPDEVRIPRLKGKK